MYRVTATTRRVIESTATVDIEANSFAEAVQKAQERAESFVSGESASVDDQLFISNIELAPAPAGFAIAYVRDRENGYSPMRVHRERLSS